MIWLPQKSVESFLSIPPPPTHQRLILVVESLCEKVPDLDGRAEEGHLPTTEKEDLVKGVEDLAAWLVDGDHHCPAGLCQHRQTLQDLQRRGRV